MSDENNKEDFEQTQNQNKTGGSANKQGTVVPQNEISEDADE